MKSLVTTLAVLVLFNVSGFAQIDVHEIGSFGTIADFSEEDRSWAGVGCDGAVTVEIIEDPDDAGNMIAAFNTSACEAEGFALQDTLVPLDFRTHYYMSVDVNAPAEGRTVAFKVFKNDDPNTFKIVQETTTRAAEWDTMHFEFDIEDSGIYDRISIHPDFGETNEGEEWLFDNVRQDREKLVPPSNGLVLDFENVTPYVHYWDCNSQTADFYIEDNPVKSELNPSDKVGVYLTSDCQWEGFAIAEKWEPINFEKYSLVKIKVLPPEVGRSFMFKVELWEDSSVMVETPIETTVEGEWEEIMYDMSGVQSDFYTKIAFFPDFLSSEEDAEWFVDEVRIVDPTSTYVDPDKVVKVFRVTAENYPNPFNPSTTISFNVPLPSDVNVTIYDINGREISTIANGHHSPGRHEIFFDASQLASGVYFYKVETSYDAVVNKMMLVR